MNIEKQCCNLQQAKRLKELGVEQISQFYWSDFGDKQNRIYIRKELGLYGVDCRYFSALFFVTPGLESGEGAFSAFTVAELGYMLPLGYYTSTRDFDHNDWMGYDHDGDYII